MIKLIKEDANMFFMAQVIAPGKDLYTAPTKAQRKDIRLNEVLMVAKMGKAEVAAMEGMVM